MHLRKLHGLGNDFLVVLDEDAGAPVPAEDGVGAALARRLCDRHRGIGADGLIVGTRPAGGEPVDLVMALYNADGGRAEMSGNGIRCLAHATALARGLAGGPLAVATDGGRRDLVLHPGSATDEVLVEVGMGPVADGPAVPAAAAGRLGGARHATVDVGNPHLVVLVDAPAAVDLDVEGPALEGAFADGANVEFIAPTEGGLDLVVWERGVGVTQACGTGACAAVAAAHRWGLVGERAVVHMPGGDAEVRLDEGVATLVGPSVHIADLEVRS